MLLGCTRRWFPAKPAEDNHHDWVYPYVDSQVRDSACSRAQTTAWTKGYISSNGNGQLWKTPPSTNGLLATCMILRKRVNNPNREQQHNHTRTKLCPHVIEVAIHSSIQRRKGEPSASIPSFSTSGHGLSAYLVKRQHKNKYQKGPRKEAPSQKGPRLLF